MFDCLYEDILGEHAPLKQVRIRGNQVPFMNEQWRKAIRQKNRLWKRFIRESYSRCRDNRQKTNGGAFNSYFVNIAEGVPEITEQNRVMEKSWMRILAFRRFSTTMNSSL